MWGHGCVAAFYELLPTAVSRTIVKPVMVYDSCCCNNASLNETWQPQRSNYRRPLYIEVEENSNNLDVGNHPVPAGQRLLKFNTEPQEQGTCNFSDASATVVRDRELVHITLERVRPSLAALPRHLLVTQRLTHKCISGEPTCAARPWAGGPATARQICNVEFTLRTNTFDIR